VDYSCNASLPCTRDSLVFCVCKAVSASAVCASLILAPTNSFKDAFSPACHVLHAALQSSGALVAQAGCVLQALDDVVEPQVGT
jgi:hypothetical protein